MDTRINTASSFEPDEPDSGAHPPADILAAYIDDRLTDEQRREVEAHIAACDECLFVVGESSLFLEKEQGEQPVMEPSPIAVPPALDKPAASVVTPPASRWGRRQWLLTGGGLLAAAAVTVLAVRMGGNPATNSTQVARLAPAAVDELFVSMTRRPSASRLSGLRYLPPVGVVRSAAPGSNQVPLPTLAAATKVEEAAARSTDADGRWALGLALLALGRVDDAIASLEGALAARPADDAIETDLAAACLQRAERTGDQTAASRGLELAERVLARTPTTLSARFNRALALDYLDRQAEAEAAWRDYLTRDASSPWADEIRERYLR